MSELFEKVKLGISKSVAKASVKSKEFLDVTKLKNQISSLQNKKQDALEELGNIAYAMFLKNNIDTDIIKNKGNEISKIDEQIKNLQNEIVEVQKRAQDSLREDVPSANTCACGAVIPEGAKFCGVCGSKVETASMSGEHPKDPILESRCKQCQTELEPGAKFCAMCGAKVS
ncbi:MAG TPA: zinc-ribbon domain-containing protein [Smithella sp.]|jgi:RNA polymerase subunit RPABC4/transcription elongation factor Spt4|nr:zinc-ribbon domain-containing protein [Smithella sp.]NMC97502.1 zinc-ribbon domain-containing protein [Deltaproteobacteria bacterium]HNQ64843.1 zinc-ribbon domain-containing protein [Smithella sp.]HOE32742.1 zinc-ribbon domain-containing protein [Smithella sp.]HOG08926.1 zinc-ribbon domain-containing protein [Smithella sp.]